MSEKRPPIIEDFTAIRSRMRELKQEQDYQRDAAIIKALDRPVDQATLRERIRRMALTRYR